MRARDAHVRVLVGALAAARMANMPRHRPESRSGDRLISQPEAARIVGVSVPSVASDFQRMP